MRWPSWIYESGAPPLLEDLHWLRHQGLKGLDTSASRVSGLVDLARTLLPTETDTPAYKLVDKLVNELLKPRLTPADQTALEIYFGAGKSLDRRRKTGMRVFHQSFTRFRDHKTGEERRFLTRLAKHLRALAEMGPAAQQSTRTYPVETLAAPDLRRLVMHLLLRSTEYGNVQEMAQPSGTGPDFRVTVAGATDTSIPRTSIFDGQPVSVVVSASVPRGGAITACIDRAWLDESPNRVLAVLPWKLTPRQRVQLREHATRRGVTQLDIWDASTLDAELHRHTDLADTSFGPESEQLRSGAPHPAAVRALIHSRHPTVLVLGADSAEFDLLRQIESPGRV